MRFFGKASGYSKVSFVLLLCAVCVFCAGFGTTSWMRNQSLTQSIDLTVGLWRMVNCSSAYQGSCLGEKLSDNYKTNLLSVTQGVETLCLVVLILAMFVQVFYVTSPTVRIAKTAVTVIILCILCTALCIGGMVAWLFNIPDNHYVSWSLGLTLIAASLTILTAILMVPDIRKYRRNEIEEEREKKKERKLRKKKLRREKSGLLSKKAYEAMQGENY